MRHDPESVPPQHPPGTPDTYTLAAWVAGALDPARSAEVRDAVAEDPALLAAALRLVDEAEGPLPDDDGWRLPLPRERVRPMAMMGQPAVGDPLVLEVPPGEGRLLVLHRSEGPWAQVLPAPGAPPIDAASLNPRRVVVVPDRPGVHDWVVLVAPAEVSDVQQAVASGAVPVRRARAEVG